MVEMLGSKAAVDSCTLPTGFLVDGKIIQDIQFREMAGPEEDIFANRKMSVSKKFTSIMQNCSLKIGDIEDRQKINSLINKMVETDRIYYLIQLRMLSIDPLLNFQTICPSCQHEDKVVFDLSGIVVKNPPSASELSREIKLPSGNELTLRVADGKAEEIIERASNEKNAISLALMSRVESFNGKPVSLSDIINLNMKDRKFLRAEIEKLEGSIDDAYDAECPACGHAYKGSVPLAGSDFLDL